jgi:hypothetical protein
VRAARLDLDYAQVTFVRAARRAGDTWSFDVTVRHNDEGWEHYADAWQILDLDTGGAIAKRVLVQARCNLQRFGGQEVRVDLARRRGQGFEVTGALR